MSRPTYSGGALDDPSVSAALDQGMEGMHEMQTFRFQQGNQSTVNAVDELEFRGKFFCTSARFEFFPLRSRQMKRKFVDSSFFYLFYEYFLFSMGADFNQDVHDGVALFFCVVLF